MFLVLTKQVLHHLNVFSMQFKCAKCSSFLFCFFFLFLLNSPQIEQQAPGDLRRAQWKEERGLGKQRRMDTPEAAFTCLLPLSVCRRQQQSPINIITYALRTARRKSMRPWTAVCAVWQHDTDNSTHPYVVMDYLSI